MNSKNASECFVYITLPGQTQANDAVEIDPVELKLSGETYARS